MIETMERLFGLLIQNFDTIGLTGLLVILIYYIISQRSKETAREDAFQNRLLDLNTRQTDNNDRIVLILERHETNAQAREVEQESRDDRQFVQNQRQIEALAKIVSYLDVVSQTQNTVETIQAITAHTQTSIGEMQEDISALIKEQTEMTRTGLEGVQSALIQGITKVNEAHADIRTRLDNLSRKHDQSTQKQKDILDEIQPIMGTLNTISLVLSSVQGLIQTLTPPVPGNAITLAKYPPNPREDKTIGAKDE